MIRQESFFNNLCKCRYLIIQLRFDYTVTAKLKWSLYMIYLHHKQIDNKKGWYPWFQPDEKWFFIILILIIFAFIIHVYQILQIYVI